MTHMAPETTSPPPQGFPMLVLEGDTMLAPQGQNENKRQQRCGISGTLTYR